MVLSCRANMGARHAVLLTLPKSSRPGQLLFYKQNASVSPLFATLTSRPQLIEKTATLSPFLATLTASAPVTPLFATLTKTAGVSHRLFPFRYSPLVTSHSPLPPREAHNLRVFCPPRRQNAKSPPLVFISLRTLLHLSGGGGAPRPHAYTLVPAQGHSPSDELLTRHRVAPCSQPDPRLHWKGSR